MLALLSAACSALSPHPHTPRAALLRAAAIATAPLLLPLPASSSSSSSSPPPPPRLVYTPPEVTRASPAEAPALARHLRARGARLYGAYWCSHCYSQKQAFGVRAAPLLPYVECAEDGYRSERALCREKGIKGYPTWEINGEYFSGEQSLVELAALSGFRAPPR
ncbi:hypothetical protein AB1Y20_004418 [Prymnesium parvum]|uniref:Thioredoxin domain-containing protein n=1 Tax=Prymnesium parvum TaxID=97485 RepID=A0AB34IWN6_PRYPA